ncbi:hypothetical protein RRF57_009153 [Xylaria bambusicola]|uniref:Peptidase M16 N-terminal domain-containing protein n=1 Tax=Xylaria bambusicola TaxID=326684 RepID=A0AAN7V2C8_9PEZI
MFGTGLLSDYTQLLTMSSVQDHAIMGPPLIERVTDELETPSIDDRQYRVIRLPNHLEVLLVHDPKTDRASAALDVNVGNFSDNKDIPGMAHAVEHLLFMGTKKYPGENTYNLYLASHLGDSNAYTGATSTNFYFEIAAKPINGEEPSAINPPPLFGALDRFAQFFIAPLFLPSTLDAELRILDLEYMKNFQNDWQRLNQLEKSQSNPKHPYCYFPAGNFKVLKTIPESKGLDVRQKLIDFYNARYSANRMKLCVLGRERLDELQSLVVDLFSNVPNKDLPQNRWEDQVLFTEDQLAVQCFAKPAAGLRQLQLSFPFLDEEWLFKTRPSRYITHLIGHKGPGSIIAYIKSKGWASSLVASVDQGLENYYEIVKVFFQYVSMLQQMQPLQWIFDELKEIADIEFRFQQKLPASYFTSMICSVMQKPLPRQWLLCGESLLRQFDPVAISKGVVLLQPKNLRMTIVSQEFPGKCLPGERNERENWYGTEYISEKIPEGLLAELLKAVNTPAGGQIPSLHLPTKNRFLPSNPEVTRKEFGRPVLAPRLIRNNQVGRTWWKKDDTFWVPKATTIISMRNPLMFASAGNYIKSTLCTDLVCHAFEESLYDARLVGMWYRVRLDSRGWKVEVSGWNNQLAILLEQVLTEMCNLDITDTMFEMVQERTTRIYKGRGVRQPFRQAQDYIDWLISDHTYVEEQFITELPTITVEDTRYFYKQVMSQLHFEAFIHGDVNKEDALKLTDIIETILQARVLPEEEWSVPRSLKLPAGSNYLYRKSLKDPANVNHCIGYYLYVGQKEDRVTLARAQLLSQILREPVFDQLRTKEKLGYAVSGNLRVSASTYGYSLLIQSESNPMYLSSRIDSFLQKQGQALQDMPVATFESHKESVITCCLEKPNNLDEETAKHWAQIISESYDFEAVRLAKLDAAQVKRVTKADMIEFYSIFIDPKSTSRAKLMVHLIASNASTKPTECKDQEPAYPNGTKVTEISSVRGFKAGLEAAAKPGLGLGEHKQDC